MPNQINVMDILRIAVQAGTEILTVYNSDDFQVKQKGDNSPLTLTDRKSHDAIIRGLGTLDVGIPILSEEGRAILYEQRKS